MDENFPAYRDPTYRGCTVLKKFVNRDKLKKWFQNWSSFARKFLMIRTNSIILINSDKSITEYLKRLYCLIDFSKIPISQRL